MDLGVIATPWSAPPSMKTSGSIAGGALATRDEGQYADLLLAQSRWLVAAGVPLRAITITNEPGYSAPYPSMTMTDDQMSTVALKIGASLRSDGVELWAVDHNWADRSRVDNVLRLAPGAFAKAAFHCYGGTPNQMAGLSVPTVVTECTGTNDSWEGTFRWDARNLVADSIRAGSTGLLMWNLVLDSSSGPKLPGGCSNCRGLLTIDSVSGAITATPEFYTLAHLSRAAAAGAIVIDSTSSTDVPVVAFSNPDGSIGVFGLNDTTLSQTIALQSPGGQQQRLMVGAHELFTVRWSA